VRKPFYKVETYRGCNSVGYLIKRIFTLMMPHVEAVFSGSELSFSQWVVLMFLRDGIADTAAAIARHMNHDTGAVTRLIDQLETRGLIRRERSTADRRVVHLELAPAGRALAKALTPGIVDFWNRMLSDFSIEECEALLGLLTRLNKRLEAEELVAEPAAIALKPASRKRRAG